MSRPSYRLTRSADQDIESILHYTLTKHGSTQTRKYSNHIEICLDTLSHEKGQIRKLCIVAMTLPMGSLGAIVALDYMGESLNVMSIVGIIILSGIDVNDAILKVDIFNKNRKKGYSLKESIIKGSEQRLRPIIMTSLRTILAMIPILYSTGLGAELQRPLAIALIGGLFCGTIASIVLVPVFYYTIYAFIDRHQPTTSHS